MEEDRWIVNRAKRQKIDNSGKAAAFERLKNLKGSKNKCEVGEVENVYEYIDEKEYSKRVLQRQDEDWIENPSNGYFEDGREIFDEDESLSLETSERQKKNKTEKSKLHSRSILQMVAKMPVKKKKEDTENNILNLLEQSIKTEVDCDDLPSQKSEVLSSKEYLKSLSNTSNSETLNNNKKNNEFKLCSRSAKSIDINKSLNNALNNTNIENLLDKESLHYVETISSSSSQSSISMPSSNFSKSFEVKNKLEETKNVPCEFNNINNDFKEIKNDLKSHEDENIHCCEQKEDKEKVTLITSEWERDTQNINIQLQNLTVDKSELPLTFNEKEETVFRFFWWDAYEDPVKQPGVVYLFGKVYYEKKKTYLSCCVAVENISRRIFLLPREKRMNLKTNQIIDSTVTLLDVYQEFNDKIATSNKIMEFKSKKTTLKYAFELEDVPSESEYLEIRYPANYNKLSQDLSGETFSRVFGTTTGSTELLLLERKIKGPCWLEIKNPQVANVQSSWCKFDVRCSRPEDLFVLETTNPPPPLVLMALNIRSVVNKNMDNEIIMIGVAVHNQYRIDKPSPSPPFNSHFCTITRSSSLFWPTDIEKHLSKYKRTEVVVHQAEKSLLNYFLTKLFTIDPDVIVGHDLFGFTLDTLIQRIQHLKIPNWSRIGRLKRAIIPQFKGKIIDKSLTCGRLVCDVITSAKELIRARSYDLSTLSKQILGVEEGTRQDYSYEEILQKFKTFDTIEEIINACMEDANYILRIIYEINALPLALQITRIAGNVMSRTLQGGRSERNEFLLLHAFTEKNYLVPDKNFSKKAFKGDEEVDEESKGNKKKPQYSGGLVFEPKKGFYDKFILLMDFNSLYPSIIQEYNICFTTVSKDQNNENDKQCSSKKLPLGILPIEIQKLVETRREVKQIMKAPNITSDLYMQHNIRQMALKLTANSMYGCLGFSYSRFYAKPLAALVTSKGREILLTTKNIVEKMHYDVVYGDTDSVMINTNCTNYEEVLSIGLKIKDEINKLYQHIELEIDGVFKYMLLLKKKKYAAVVLSKKPSGELISTKEYKGLDIVRRDWCQLSAEIGKNVLNQILSEINPDDRITNIKDHLERISEDLRSRKVPVSLLAITKQLTKNPENYSDVKSLPHLQVAKRMNSKGGKRFKVGNTVSYVICDNGTNLPPLQRAYHVDELKSNPQLLVDTKYYLEQQIHPVVSRICEPLDGMDAVFVAECLGLDPNLYRKTIFKSEKDSESSSLTDDCMLLNDLEAFKQCEPFTFTCKNENCGTVNFIESPMRDSVPALSKCRNPACKMSPVEFLTYITNELGIKIRNYVEKFYQNWMVCEDPSCSNRTQRVPMKFSNAFPICTLCHKGVMYREFSSSDLFYQMKYYKYIFTLEGNHFDASIEIKAAYKILQEKVQNVLNDSAYNILDLGKIFGKKI